MKGARASLTILLTVAIVAAWSGLVIAQHAEREYQRGVSNGIAEARADFLILACTLPGEVSAECGGMGLPACVPDESAQAADCLFMDESGRLWWVGPYSEGVK